MLRSFAVACVLCAILGCGDSTDGLNCRDGRCVCNDDTDCAFDCQGNGCNALCEQLTTCDGECGDGCSLTCRDTSVCEFLCGDRCTIVCERAGVCTVSCDQGCNVTCEDSSACNVTMGSGGTLQCNQTDNCALTCPDNLTPTDCGNGLLACPPVTCPS